MDKKTKALELILAYLVDKPVTADELQWAVEQAATDLETQTIFEQLEATFSRQNNPEWLEAIAAYSEGLVTPDVAAFLANREALSKIAPDVVADFDALTVSLQADDELILPASPGFAEQFRANQGEVWPPASEKEAASFWIKERAGGFQWQLREAGGVVIRFLKEAAAQQLTPIAVLGNRPAMDFIRRVTLDPDQTGNLDLAITIRRQSEASQNCILIVEAVSPDLWTDPAGIQVQVAAGDWRSKGKTNAEGEVIFEGLPVALVDELEVEVRAPKEEP